MGAERPPCHRRRDLPRRSHGGMKVDSWGHPLMGPTRQRGPYPEPALPHNYNAKAIALIEGTCGSFVHLPLYGGVFKSRGVAAQRPQAAALADETPATNTCICRSRYIQVYMEHVAPARPPGLFREAANGRSLR